MSDVVSIREWKKAKAVPRTHKPVEDRLRELDTAVYSLLDVVEELQDWGYIGNAEVVDPTWIDVAYTWAWPGSTWKAQALRLLEEHSVYMVGRYARWIFQGLADSIRDGFFTGACFKKG